MCVLKHSFILSVSSLLSIVQLYVSNRNQFGCFCREQNIKTKRIRIEPNFGPLFFFLVCHGQSCIFYAFFMLPVVFSFLFFFYLAHHIFWKCCWGVFTSYCTHRDLGQAQSQPSRSNWHYTQLNYANLMLELSRTQLNFHHTMKILVHFENRMYRSRQTYLLAIT